ncbi:hypothetical protein F4820DRAFT_471834 [Hypoxylon rubiginosum]|uniref:Uncharacterized protein n=1 Tax=Hypoxylon rubiginosum TaxID=110542 RepID=A0ACB9ZCW2_9PEZI|nr:hypothetical protein F4820DRAFT_471834 [Hypoxylon rubiginosum]
MDDQPIKVYATSDGGIAHWTNPRRVHLHKKTPSGTTVCCPSVTAGGVVQAKTGEVYFLTTHAFVPASGGEDEELRSPYADTNDATCARIGTVEHTSPELRFALIAVSDAVAHAEAVARARDRCYLPPHKNLGPTAACLHYQAVRYQFKEAGEMRLLARTRYDEAIHGVMTGVPEAAEVRPSSAPFPGRTRSSGLMTARFGGASLPGRGSAVEVGMWVYARRLGSGGGDAATNKMLDARDVGPYPPETFQYVPPAKKDDSDADASAAPNPNPLVLVGHVVEVQGQDRDPDGSVTVKIQNLYEVLERIVFFGV